MGEYGQMIAPYQAQPTGGRGILDFVQDFMVQKQQRAGMAQQQQLLGEQAGVDRATRDSLNAQNGYDQGVDPFGIQKFMGQQQIQDQSGTIFQNGQDDRTRDRNFLQSAIDQYRQNPDFNGDSVMGPMLNSGYAPAALDHVLKFAGQDRENDARLGQAKEMFGLENQAAQERMGMEGRMRGQQAIQEMQLKAAMAQALEQSKIDRIREAIQSRDREGILAGNINSATETGDLDTALEAFRISGGDIVHNAERDAREAKEKTRREAAERKVRNDKLAAMNPDESFYYQNDPQGNLIMVDRPQQIIKPTTPQETNNVFELQKRQEREANEAIKNALKTGGQGAVDILLKLLEGASNVKG